MQCTGVMNVDVTKYPQWLQEILHETGALAHQVAHHEAWYRFSDGTIPQEHHHALLIGFWPLIERFPQYLALNLLKCSFGENQALNRTRGWLLKNLRVEQRHAEMYRDWAEAAGIPREQLFEANRSAAATAITDWCWHVCESSGLAEGMAATNFAIEGVTGEWAKMVGESEIYQRFFLEPDRKKAMKWIFAHATYDDTHPVEALDLIHAQLGNDPDPEVARKVGRAIQKSYGLYLLALDTGMSASSKTQVVAA